MAFDVLIFTKFILGCLLLQNVISDVLYNKDDPLNILTGDTFEGSIFSQPHASVVEFYNSWCGHCIRFAPTWKEFSRSIDGWKPVVKVAVVDCSEENNLAICRKYDITAYPTIKFFAPGSEIGHHGKTLNDSHDTVEKLENELIRHLTLHSDSFNNFDVKTLLSPLSQLDETWKRIPLGAQYAVVIFEEDNSFLGRKIMLDALEYKEVFVARMLQKKIPGNSEISVPSLNLLDKESRLKQLVSSESDREVYKQAICDLIGVILQSEAGAGESPDIEQEQSIQLHQSDALVHMQDLESTLHYAFRQEIATCKTIGGEKLEALKTFVSVINKYLPVQEPIKHYISAVHSWLQTQHDTMTGSQWLESINNLQTDLAWLPSNLNWTGCQPIGKRHRSYPCGAWTMFHTLAANSLGDIADTEDPKEVLMGMKAYIIHFFGCADCVKNFKNEIRELDNIVHDRDTAMLFLWQVHNSVNKRLRAANPASTKVQFPTNETCPQCYVTFPNNSIGWNKDGVHAFLIRTYSAKNIIRDSVILKPFTSHLSNSKDEKRREDFLKFSDFKINKQRNRHGDALEGMQYIMPDQRKLDRILQLKEIEAEGRGNDSERKSSYLGMNSIDFSMCLIFYFGCICLMVIVYYKLFMRRRQRFQKLPV